MNESGRKQCFFLDNLGDQEKKDFAPIDFCRTLTENQRSRYQHKVACKGSKGRQISS